MNTKWFQTRRTTMIRLTGVCILWVFCAPGLSPVWAEPDASGAVMGIAASSAFPVKYTVDERSGTLTWLQGSFQPSVPSNPVESAYAFMEKHRGTFRINNPRAEFSVMVSKKGLLVADDHVYLEQRIQGLPVWGRRLGFHYDKKGRLYAVNGKYVATPNAILNTKPALTKEEAFVKAVQDFQTIPNKAPAGTSPRQFPASNHPLPINQQIPCKGELMFYPDQAGGLHLCYRVAFSVTAPPGDWIYFVDARSGAILYRMNNIQTSGPAVGSGLDLFNNVISLNSYLDTDEKYKLINTTKNMYTRHSTHPYTTWQGCVEIRDCQHVESGGSPTSSDNNPVVYDPDGDNVFTYGGSDYRNNYQSAVQLAKFLSDTYDFYGNIWERNSLDDLGVSMIGNIHLGTKYDNSMWSPVSKMMFFGDSSDDYWPESRSLDTVTHEATHGVTTYAVPPDGYIYITESGAINESLSDIGAVTHDYDNWNYGEDYHKDGTASRRFDDPTAVAQPQPKDMYDFYLMPLQLDNGGVHYNSGIGNHFFYQFAMRLPAESPASDGRFKASHVTYRSYVYGAANPLATFQEWGQYIKQACVDLYGPGDIYNKVVEALDYVHIPQAMIGGHDNWQLLLDNVGEGYFFALNRGFPSCWPVCSTRFTRPSSGAKLKTIGVMFKNLGSATYRIWYTTCNADGSPNESTAQLLVDGFSSGSIRSDAIFNNFKLTNSMSVAGDFHIAVDMTSGTYGGLYHDSADPSTERSWFKYMTYSGGIWYYQWYKIKEYFALYPDSYPAGFDPTLMIKVIYETTPLSAPSAPTLVSPSNGETVNNWQVSFSWNSVSGADRYFLEVNSSSSWDENARVYFATVYNTSQTVSGFPIGVNYWRVWAGNADAWSCASETRSFTETVPPPTLSCSVSSMSASATPVQGSFNQSFNVYNSGSGTLTYSITDDAGWLSISPTNGTSTGESYAIQVTFNPSGLCAGVYNATITVSASGAYGSPKTIPVTLTVLDVNPLAADFDGDAKADPAVVMSGNPSTGSGQVWYVWLSSCGYYRVGPFSFSESGWTSAAGDFDGDGRADPSGMNASSYWYIRFSYSGYMRGGPYLLGDSSYSPLIADFDGDGYADTAGMNSSGNWLIWFSSSGYLRGGPYAFGGSGCVPRAGDFDGDRLADPAAVDNNGNWYIWFSGSGYLRGGPYAVGASGLTAVAGDFDGDRRADTAGTDGSGNWYFWLSSAGYRQLGPVHFALP